MDIRPFRGWRYRMGPDQVLDTCLAPPYDVLTARDKQDLLAANDKNIVAVDMPQVPPSEAGPDKLYHAAADTLGKWQDTGVLAREDRPAIYLYRQTYSWHGRSYTRTAMICGVRATELGQDVIPHEQTHTGPKADRVKLTEHTRTQLSPVFGFYHDGDGRVGELLGGASDRPADARGQLQDVGQEIWAVVDRETIDAVSAALRDQPVFIADGHHRYLTGLSYVQSLGQSGRIDEDHPANFVMFALVAQDDPGLVILPSHRLVSGLGARFSLDKLVFAAKDFIWQRTELKRGELDDPEAFLSRFGPGAMAFVAGEAREVWIAKLIGSEAMKRAAPEKSDAWRDLDVAILQTLIIDGALGLWSTKKLAVRYTPRAGSVLDACASGEAALGVCLQHTPLSAVRKVALAGETMPPKSTYFYPKMATGTVLMPLE